MTKLEYVNNTMTIVKKDRLGGNYELYTDIKDDFGLVYDSIRYINNEDGLIAEYCYEHVWNKIPKDVITTIEKYIEDIVIPEEHYPEYFKNVQNKILLAMNKYIENTNSFVIDNIEDGVPVPEIIKHNRKITKKYITILSDFTIEEDVYVKNVKLWLSEINNTEGIYLKEINEQIHMVIPDWKLENYVNGL